MPSVGCRSSQLALSTRAKSRLRRTGKITAKIVKRASPPWQLAIGRSPKFSSRAKSKHDYRQACDDNQIGTYRICKYMNSVTTLLPSWTGAETRLGFREACGWAWPATAASQFTICGARPSVVREDSTGGSKTCNPIKSHEAESLDLSCHADRGVSPRPSPNSRRGKRSSTQRL